MDDLGALLLRHLEARLDAVDREDAARALQPRARYGELAHRPAAEHHHRVARLDLGEVGAEVGGRKNIGEEDRLLVAYRVGQLDEVRRRIGDARVFRLQAVEIAARVAAAIERGAGVRALGVRNVALRLVAGAAVAAIAAGDGRRHHDAVALAQVAHVLAALLDDADRLVTEDRSGLHAGKRAADEVQVGAADGARGDADQRIGGLVDLRLADRLEANVADALENDGFHVDGLLSESPRRKPRADSGTEPELINSPPTGSPQPVHSFSTGAGS